MQSGSVFCKAQFIALPIGFSYPSLSGPAIPISLSCLPPIFRACCFHWFCIPLQFQGSLFPLHVLPPFSGPLLIGLSCLAFAGYIQSSGFSSFSPICRDHFPLAYLATHFEGLMFTLAYLGCPSLFSSIDLIDVSYPCCIYFIPEGGGIMFLRNTGYYLLDYMTSYLR